MPKISSLPDEPLATTELPIKHRKFLVLRGKQTFSGYTNFQEKTGKESVTQPFKKVEAKYSATGPQKSHTPFKENRRWVSSENKRRWRNDRLNPNYRKHWSDTWKGREHISVLLQRLDGSPPSRLPLLANISALENVAPTCKQDFVVHDSSASLRRAALHAP